MPQPAAGTAGPLKGSSEAGVSPIIWLPLHHALQDARGRDKWAGGVGSVGLRRRDLDGKRLAGLKLQRGYSPADGTLSCIRNTSICGT